MSSISTDAVFSTDQMRPIAYYLNPIRLLLHLWRKRSLIYQFTLREVQGRYKGSYLGVVWSIINPLLMLAVFTFVFHVIMPIHWHSEHENFMDFAMNLYSGLIAFNIFSESVNKSALLVTSNPNYVKKVVFPLEVLSLSIVGSALFHGLLSLVVMLGAAACGAFAIHTTILYIPILCIPLTLLTIGSSWLLASLGVFMRDIGQFIAVFVQLLFYLTPVVYPMDRLKSTPWLFNTMKLNPFASIVENFRRVVNDGVSPDWGSWVWVTLLGCVVTMGGYGWFMKLKRAFADVI